MIVALLAFAAHAGCTVTLSSPADGATRTSTPGFHWTGDCASYRVQLSGSGTFGDDKYNSASLTGTDWHINATAWDAHVSSDWADGVYWRVVGIDANGHIERTNPFFLYTTIECPNVASCGPALGMPNRLCADGVNWEGPSGRCLKTGAGTCGWEVLSCPP